MPVSEKPSPAGFKLNFRFPYSSSEASWPRDSYIRGLGDRCESFLPLLLLSSRIFLFSNSTHWYNSCLYLQASILADYCHWFFCLGGPKQKNLGPHFSWPELDPVLILEPSWWPGEQNVLSDLGLGHKAALELGVESNPGKHTD